MSRIFMGVAMVFFILAALAAAGIASNISWAVDAGLAAMAASFLV